MPTRLPAGVCDRLHALGYVDGVDLLAMPYDWRLGPQNWMHVNGPAPQWGYFSQLKAAIETAVDTNGGNQLRQPQPCAWESQSSQTA